MCYGQYSVAHGDQRNRTLWLTLESRRLPITLFCCCDRMGFHFFKDMTTSQKAFNSQIKLEARTSMIHLAIGFHGHQINTDDIMLVHYASGFVIQLINSDEFCCHRLWRKALICNKFVLPLTARKRKTTHSREKNAKGFSSIGRGLSFRLQMANSAPLQQKQRTLVTGAESTLYLDCFSCGNSTSMLSRVVWKG